GVERRSRTGVVRRRPVHARGTRPIQASDGDTQESIGQERPRRPCAARPERSEIGDACRRGTTYEHIIKVIMSRLEAVAVGESSSGRASGGCRQGCSIIVQLDTDDGIFPLPIVADECAEAAADRILLGKHQPLRNLLIPLDRKQADFVGDLRAHAVGEVDVCGRNSDLTAAINSGPTIEQGGGSSYCPPRRIGPRSAAAATSADVSTRNPTTALRMRRRTLFGCVAPRDNRALTLMERYGVPTERTAINWPGVARDLDRAVSCFEMSARAPDMPSRP